MQDRHGAVKPFVIIPAAVKRRRQNLILEAVRSARIESQDDLLKALRSRGVQVSQSTLSRDIQEIGLAKSGGAYTAGPDQPKVTVTGDAVHRILREFVVDVALGQGILVIKTTPGSAGSVAQALDDAAWPEPLGTLAGDNTIFVATRSGREATRLEKRLRDLLR